MSDNAAVTKEMSARLEEARRAPEEQSPSTRRDNIRRKKDPQDMDTELRKPEGKLVDPQCAAEEQPAHVRRRTDPQDVDTELRKPESLPDHGPTPPPAVPPPAEEPRPSKRCIAMENILRQHAGEPCSCGKKGGNSCDNPF